jgi:heme-degrading monooxygenase HmoA
MIVRVWRGRVGKQNERAYIEHLTGHLFPAFRTIDGFLGGLLLKDPRGDGVDFMVITRWGSMEAIRRFAGADVTRAVVEPAAQEILIEYDRVVKHYEFVAEISGAGHL